MRHDAIVIGSGPAGVAAAVEAATQGIDVILVDDGSLSPNGVLRRHALDFHQLREMVIAMRRTDEREEGGTFARSKRCWDAAMERARELALAELARIRTCLASLGVGVEEGAARFVAPLQISVGERALYEADVILLAPGCRPRRPGRFPWENGIFHDPRSVLELESPPRSLLVVGAEEEGCEVASLFAALGSEVTLLDRRRRMLRYVDREIVEIFYECVHEMGMEVTLGETLGHVDEVMCGDPHALVELGSGRVQRWERVVVAANHVAEVEGLDLARAGVALDAAGFVAIDDFHRTSADGVYAAGDAAAGSLQTHALPREGRQAMRHALGLDGMLQEAAPLGIHAIPEIAMAGFSEEMCSRLDLRHEVGIARYDELPLALARREEVGMLKLVVDRGSRCLLGAHVIGADARELIQRAVGAMLHEETVDDLAVGAIASPSLSEAYALAASRCRWRLQAGAESV